MLSIFDGEGTKTLPQVICVLRVCTKILKTMPSTYEKRPHSYFLPCLDWTKIEINKLNET